MSAGALDRALARGMLVTAAFAALAGAARVAQDAAIAWHHGTGPSADAYYLVLSLVNWPTAMALSTLTLLVGPTEAALQQGNARQGARWRGELLGRVLLIAALSLPAAWWALHATVSGGWSGLDTAAMAAASTGIPLIVAAVPLGLLGALFAAWLVAAGRPVLTLMEAVPPLVLTLLLLTAQGPVLFWGTALGAALQVLAMAWLLHAAGALPRPRLHASADTAVLRASFARGAWVLLAGQGLFALVPLVDPFFAARTGEGMVAAMGFANRLVLGLQGLAGLALQRAGLPILSRLATESPGDAWRASQRWALVAAGAGAAVGLVVAAAAGSACRTVSRWPSCCATACCRCRPSWLARCWSLRWPRPVAATGWHWPRAWAWWPS
jgi:putative peptidoglycan lipid II flippase